MRRVKNILRRVRLWMTPRKGCPYCCLRCGYFERCESEVLYGDQ